jgi:Putative zinc-finger
MPLDVVTPEIRRYLLGDLDEAAAAALEERYVADPALLDDVRAAEDMLIEAFLDGSLGPADRARFEAHYLASPVHRDRVAIARALRLRAAGPPQASAPGARFYGWLAIAAAVVLASLWIVSRAGSPPPQQVVVPQTPRSQPQAPESAPAPAPAPPLVPAPAPAPMPARAVLALTLSPIATRGGDQSTHARPAGPVDLVLRLEGAPAGSDRAYDAELQTVDGRVVWRGRSRAAAAGSGLLTTVRVPADTLAADDYVVVIATPGREERGRYVLRLRTR